MQSMPTSHRRSEPIRLGAFLLGALLVTACAPEPSAGYQGYLEGEYVHVAAPLGGRLDHLAVRRGQRVTAGDPLFALEAEAERAAQREAAGRLEQAQARLADLGKGQRPSELAALEARFAQARAAAELSAIELRRARELHTAQVIAADALDRARLDEERNRRVLDEVSAQLDTARLGARPDALAAAGAEIHAAEAALARARWAVAEKTVSAATDALVFDTLHRPGEFVAAGAPVVTLLPPENIKVRFFVPEADFGALRLDQVVRVTHTGLVTPLEARIDRLSPRPEFTPPILYNRENRAKLVFLVEASFAPDVARGLHPGQPVDVVAVP